MISFDNEFVTAFDIDDTLVMWEGNFNQPAPDRIEIIDPYDGAKVFLKPHKKHAAFMKKCKGRGMCVMVWSAGGVQWAKAVINALGLADYVDLVITKPSKYVDDLPASEILGSRIYLKNE